jgi:hypothetical protein
VGAPARRVGSSLPWTARTTAVWQNGTNIGPLPIAPSTGIGKVKTQPVTRRIGRVADVERLQVGGLHTDAEVLEAAVTNAQPPTAHS